MNMLREKTARDLKLEGLNLVEVAAGFAFMAKLASMLQPAPEKQKASASSRSNY